MDSEESVQWGMLHNNVCKKNYDSGEAIGGNVALKRLSIAIDT